MWLCSAEGVLQLVTCNKSTASEVENQRRMGTGKGAPHGPSLSRGD